MAATRIHFIRIVVFLDVVPTSNAPAKISSVPIQRCRVTVSWRKILPRKTATT